MYFHVICFFSFDEISFQFMSVRMLRFFIRTCSGPGFRDSAIYYPFMQELKLFPVEFPFGEIQVLVNGRYTEVSSYSRKLPIWKYPILF
jgi:hypothetical protein